MKNAEQSESHIFPIERRLEIFRFGYAWAFVADGDKIGRCRFPESVG